MKKKLLLFFSILLAVTISAQIDVEKSKINPGYLNFLPSNANPKDLRELAITDPWGSSTSFLSVMWILASINL